MNTRRTFAAPRRDRCEITFRRPAIAVWIVAAVLIPTGLAAQVNVLTNRYDPQRTGANLAETVLTPATST